MMLALEQRKEEDASSIGKQKNLENNLEDLQERLKRRDYEPKPVRRVRFRKTMVIPDRCAFVVMKINWCRKN